MENFGFYMPTRLFFGAGSVKRLAKVRLPQGTGLIITGGTSTTKLGYVAKVADTLAEAGHPTVVYNKVQPNPPIEGVRECAEHCICCRSRRRLVHRHGQGGCHYGDQRR